MIYQRILVPVDGSPTSLRALQEAARLAAGQNARLRIIHVIENRPYYVPEMPYADHQVEASLREAGERILEQAAGVARQQGIACETDLLDSIRGPIATLIIEDAGKWGADLIVIGTHGRHGVSRLLLGSVAERVVRLAQISVLLVHETTDTAPAATVTRTATDQAEG